MTFALLTPPNSVSSEQTSIIPATIFFILFFRFFFMFFSPLHLFFISILSASTKKEHYIDGNFFCSIYVMFLSHLSFQFALHPVFTTMKTLFSCDRYPMKFDRK